MKPLVECAVCGRKLTATTVEPYAMRDAQLRPARYFYVRGHNTPAGEKCPCDHSAPMVRIGRTAELDRIAEKLAEQKADGTVRRVDLGGES